MSLLTQLLLGRARMRMPAVHPKSSSFQNSGLETHPQGSHCPSSFQQGLGTGVIQERGCLVVGVWGYFQTWWRRPRIFTVLLQSASRGRALRRQCASGKLPSRHRLFRASKGNPPMGTFALRNWIIPLAPQNSSRTVISSFSPLRSDRALYCSCKCR